MTGHDRPPPEDPNLAGDEDLARLRAILTTAVARVCPRRLADQREDLVQAAMIRVLESQKRSEQPGIRTASYLWKVAYTAMVDELRRVDRRREAPMEDGLSETVGSGGESIRHLGIEIRECIARLIEPRRLAVALHLHGFQAEEASRALGWGLKRVRNLTYRGLADLRRCLEAKGLRP